MPIIEILLILFVAFCILKPEDLFVLLKQVRNIKRYFIKLQHDVMNSLEEPDNIDDINKYLEKIAALGSKYDGDYDLISVKSYYHKVLRENKNVR